MSLADPAQTIAALAHLEPSRVLGGVSPLVAVWSQTAVDAEVRGLQQHAIALHLGGCTLVEKWRDGKLVGHRSRVDSVSLVPAFETTRWVLGGALRVAHLYVDPAALAEANDAAGEPPVRLRDFFAESDAALAALMRRLIVPGDAMPEPLVRDEIVAAVHRHLLLHYRDDGLCAAPERRITLTLPTLRRVFAHIDAHVDQPLRLADLAALARLSPDHFLRAFKAAVGQTPHQYVLGQRIAQAQRLLRGTRMPLSEVLSATGFRSASHFAASFRQRVGLSPSDWRGVGCGR